MQINSNSKPKFPQILINDSIIQENDSPILSTPPRNENLTPSPSPLPQNRKKPSTLHTKRFSVNLLPKKSLTRPKIDLTQKHQPRKSSLEIGSGLEKSDLEGKIEEEQGMKKKIVRKETLRKRKINIEEDFEKTEKRLFLTQFFFEEKKLDLVIERNKIAKNWLKNISFELYPNFIINAFNLNNIVFEEFEARKKQNKEKEGNLHQQYQQIINKRLALESFMPEKRVPRVMLINQKYNSSGCEGILLVKKGSTLPVNVMRRVFFISPFNIGMPETEKRYSFIQIKEKTPINQKKLSNIKDFNEHFKQYPLPESVFLEKKNEKTKWKIKEHDFRISVFMNSKEKPLFLYSKTQRDAVEISDYLKFKSFMKIIPHYSLFWKKMAMAYYSKVANKIFELAEIYTEKLIARSVLFKDDDDSSSSEDDDNDSGEEKQEIIGSSTSLTKTRNKDVSLNRKTQQLFLVLKCLQEELVKYFTKNWLQVAFATQKQHFESHRSFYGLEPREIMFFETRKKKLMEIETLKKEANVMNIERFVMRRFVANWLEMSSRIYKDKLLMKINDNNTIKQKNSVKIKLKTITIPCKLDYFKPKIKLKLSRKEIDKPRYVFIDKKRVLAEKKEFFQIINDTHLKERKLGGLLLYEIIGKSIEISEFEPNQDFLTIEIFDDSCLSIYEKLKNPNSFNMPADSQEKKLENLDITLFLASSRLITHKTQVFLNDLIGKNSKNKEDYWFSLDYCLDSSNEKTENNPNSMMTSNMGSQENIGNQVVDEGFQEDFKIFLNFESSQFEEEYAGNKFIKEAKVMDSVFNGNLTGMVEAFLEPKNMKKMGILQILAGNLSEESILQLSHEKDIEVQMSKISNLLSLKANEYICKSYVELFMNSTFWFLSKFPSLSDDNSIKTRSFFLHYFNDFHSKSPDSIRNLSIKGLPNQLRRLLWGFQHREGVFMENLAKFTNFRTENNIVKALPTPLIEETLYALFQDEEILLKYDRLNYLSFIQDMAYEIRENINKKPDFRHFLKRNSHHEAILRLLKAAFFWSLINSSRIAATAHLISLLIRLFQVFEGNYPYYHNTCFESHLFKRISPAIYMESDVFWCFITILSMYFQRYFLLEAPKNPVMTSNYYCNSDLRGVKGDLLFLKLYLQEKYFESIFTQECFKTLRFDWFLSEILLSLGIEILEKRIDVWARFFDLILLSKANNEENIMIMGIIGAVFARIQRRTGKVRANIKTFKEFMLLLSLEINLIEDIEGFFEFVNFEKKMIKEMIEKRGKIIEKFEQEYLLSVHFDRYNKYNRILYNFSEQIKPFNNFDPSQKLSLSDFYSILSIENLLKEEKKSLNPSLLHVFIHNLTLLYSSSFEGGLILELVCEENIREFPIKLIVDTRIELNHYQCLKLAFSKGNAIELKFNIYQTIASEDPEKKMVRKLIKYRKIPLNALTSGILYKNSYNLISCEQDFNFLISQISVSLLLGPFSQEKNRWDDHLKNNEYAGYNVLFDGRNLWKSIRFCEKEEIEPEKKNNFINSFRNLVFENNKILISKIKDENSLDETQIAENSASCEIDPFSWKFRSGLDFISFKEICKRLFQRESPEKQQKIAILFDQLINLSENHSKLDFFEFFAGLIIILSGTFESKLELFFKLLVLLNKGNQDIPLYLFKGFVIKLYMFLGYFVTYSDLENFIDNAYFMNLEENIIEKAEIRKNSKKESISFEFSELLNDFIIKKQEMTHSRDLILGSAEDLIGLREIIKFYIDNYNDKYQKLSELFSENNEDFIKFFDLEIIYRSNQGLRQLYTVKIDENWRIIEQDAIFSNITLDFLLRGEAGSTVEHKVLNEGFFYHHRNVLVLTAQATSLMTKKQVLGIFNSLPLFKYHLSLQNLHKVFNKINDNDISYFGSGIFEPVSLQIKINLENGVNFNAGVKIAKEHRLVNTKEKLHGLKAKKLALLLESSKSFSVPKENNNNINNKSGFSKEKQEITTFDISLEKVPFFAPMKDTLQKLLIKIMKKLQEMENIEYYSKYSDFIHTFPILNLIDKSLIFNNPIDLENMSFFTLFFLNKRCLEFNFEASFIRKLSRKSDDILSENTVFSKKARALALFRHCDQSTQWLPVNVLHSFLPIEMIVTKINKNKPLDLENKHNYDYFTVSFNKFPCEVLMKKPKEIIFLRKHDLGNMQIPREIKEFLPKFNKVPKWKEILQGKEEKFGESIFKEILQEDLIVSRKLTIDERKRIERKPGKRVLSYINKKVE